MRGGGGGWGGFRKIHVETKKKEGIFGIFKSVNSKINPNFFGKSCKTLETTKLGVEKNLVCDFTFKVLHATQLHCQ